MRAQPTLDRVSRQIRGSQEAHDSLISALCTLLKIWRVPHSRVNQRPVMTIAGWRNQGADLGFPDIVATLAPSGRCLLIEAKTGRSQLSDVQKAVREEWTRAGAVWITARSINDLGEALGRRAT